MQSILKIDQSDNVVVALEDLKAGQLIMDGITARETIPAKHKIALEAFSKGATVRMYGVTVGTTTKAIPVGGLLTVDNIVHAAGAFTADQEPIQVWKVPDVSRWDSYTFNGYHRSDGKVGTANHWLVVPLVFCENRNLRIMQESLVEALGYDRKDPYARLVDSLIRMHGEGAKPDEMMAASIQDKVERSKPVFPNVDGVKFLSHGLGCGGSPDDAQALCRLLAGYITHPNVAGATILSLGCQDAQVSILEEAIAKRATHHDRPVQIFEQQKWQSEQSMLSEALKRLFVSLEEANGLKRQAASLDKLTIGLECGGSDGFSGISANPVLGSVSDWISAIGGRVILSEFPELCGIEQELVNRCQRRETAEKFVEVMNRYSRRATASGSPFYLNPSPGNIRDGLITDAIKSAGAAKKGGTSPVVDVLDYTEPLTRAGLNLLCTPGNDVESTTAMVGSGANLILFTTGLGTPTGNPVAPTLKVSTNSTLAQGMSDIIDFDTGPVISGESTIPNMAEALMEQVIQTASGSYIPKSVRLGQDDFLPWKRGVSL